MNFIRITRFLAVAVTASLMTGVPTHAQTIKLKEKEDGKGGTICTLKVPRTGKLRLNFKESRRCKNDETSSIVLQDIPKDTVIQLFDSPDFRESDDWLEIRTLRDIGVRVIPELDRSLTGRDVSVRYSKKDGLRGKVSAIIVGTLDADPCRKPVVRLITNGDEGPLVATVRSNCVSDMRLRIRQEHENWFDQTLAENSGHTSNLRVQFRCQPHRTRQFAFAEAITNGNKYKTRKVEVCADTLKENDSVRTPPQRGISAIFVANCNTDGRSHDVWILTSDKGWQSKGALASEWSNGGCRPIKPMRIDLEPKKFTTVAVIDDGLLTCRTPSDPRSGQCQTLFEGPFLGNPGGPTASYTTN